MMGEENQFRQRKAGKISPRLCSRNSRSFTTFSTSESTSIHPTAALPANLAGLLGKSSYGKSAASKKAGRTDKTDAGPYSIVGKSSGGEIWTVASILNGGNQ
jgi:hypothetical protein